MKSEKTSAVRTSLFRPLAAACIILLQTGCSLVGIRTTAEPNYSVLQVENQFEIREYETMLVAETLVDTSFEDAGGIAFRRLFSYISGDNAAASEIAMTAPVMALDENRSTGAEISMTAPVTGQQTPRGWRYAFVLPSSYTLASAPVPGNSEVSLKQLPARKVAVVRYSGARSKADYLENLELLQQWMRQNGLEANSPPRLAGYDPPWTLPFMRRNEVMIDIKG